MKLRIKNPAFRFLLCIVISMARTKFTEKERTKAQASEAGSGGKPAASPSGPSRATDAPAKKDRKYTRKTLEKRKLVRDLRQLAKRETFVPFSALTKLIRPIAAEAADAIGGGISSSSLRISAGALRVLQEGSEGYVSQILLKANRYARHANRVTLQPKDLAAVCRDIYEDSGCRITDDAAVSAE